MKEDLKRIRKLRFNNSINFSGKTLKRTKHGYFLNDKWIADRATEALDYLLNHEEDPYDEARL